jgi:multidrug efflux pump subunit AcrA (membrane-fusion protein)
MKSVRVTITALVVASVVAAAFLLPLPVSRVRQVGLVEVKAANQAKVYVTIPGKLERLYVRDGQRVEQGDVLAEFSNIELENLLAKEESLCEIYEKEAGQLGAQIQQVDSSQRGVLVTKQGEARKELQTHQIMRDLFRKQLRQDLRLVAPRAGVVMRPPQIDEVGRSFESDQTQPFCKIGDLQELRVVVPVSPADYHLLQSDLHSLAAKGEELRVELRVQGRDDQIWRGRITELPQEAAETVPGQLTAKMGGPIAIKPGGRPGRYEPQAQQYLIHVAIVDPDNAICPGGMAQVKVHCRWRTAAWWVYRTVSNTFDLGLI